MVIFVNMRSVDNRRCLLDREGVMRRLRLIMISDLIMFIWIGEEL